MSRATIPARRRGCGERQMKRRNTLPALVATGVMAASPAALAAAGDECIKVLGYEWSGEKQSMDPADMHSGDDAYHTFAVYNRLVDVDDNFNVAARARERLVGVRRRPDLDLQAARRRQVPRRQATSPPPTSSTRSSGCWIPARAPARRRCWHFLKPENVKAVDPLTVTFTHQGSGGRVPGPDHRTSSRTS